MLTVKQADDAIMIGMTRANRFWDEFEMRWNAPYAMTVAATTMAMTPPEVQDFLPENTFEQLALIKGEGGTNV